MMLVLSLSNQLLVVCWGELGGSKKVSGLLRFGIATTRDPCRQSDLILSWTRSRIEVGRYTIIDEIRKNVSERIEKAAFAALFLLMDGRV